MFARTEDPTGDFLNNSTDDDNTTSSDIQNILKLLIEMRGR